MLSMLSGKCYAHIAALRCDRVLPELLGMNKIVSEDAVRRAFAAIDEDEGAAWLRRHLDYCVLSPANLVAIALEIDTAGQNSRALREIALPARIAGVGCRSAPKGGPLQGCYFL